jgi:hypothetical protein
MRVRRLTLVALAERGQRAHARSHPWLNLCGEEFAAMDGGMSYAQVQAAVAESENVMSDPPRVLDLDKARQHIVALDRLPRPTLVTCRRRAALVGGVYLDAGLKAGASADEVLARADADAAPFAASTTFATSWR